MGGDYWLDLSDNGLQAYLNGGTTYSATNGGLFDFDGIKEQVETNILKADLVLVTNIELHKYLFLNRSLM